MIDTNITDLSFIPASHPLMKDVGIVSKIQDENKALKQTIIIGLVVAFGAFLITNFLKKQNERPEENRVYIRPE
jgi:uridine phosphorylase